VLAKNPALPFGPLYGPVLYDTFPRYHHHWLIDSVTEYDSEPEQLNVYDALYTQLGIPYGSVDGKYKRPYITLDATDMKNLDSFYFFAWNDRKVDLRQAGYYVVAPLSHSTLRSANYATWLEIISEMAKRRITVVIGSITERMPRAEMSFSEFKAALSKLPNVISVLGETPVRLIMAIIQKAVALVGLDSGPLYIAQAFRTPAISLWGPHDPRVRIGYDKDCMDLAIWNSTACRHAPCFAYQKFPEHLCPRGADQLLCEVLNSVVANQIFEKLNMVEATRRGPGKIIAGHAK
jgi:ADP-heptose:LPS heptosyltransferase